MKSSSAEGHATPKIKYECLQEEMSNAKKGQVGFSLPEVWNFSRKKNAVSVSVWKEKKLY